LKIRVRAELVYTFPENTQALVAIHVARTPDQSILSESLVLSPDTPILQDMADHHGERRFRADLAGETSIVYEAIVENAKRAILPAGASLQSWLELPPPVLEFLLPSRYCPSDKFMSFAHREFGHLAPGGAQVLAVLEWVHAKVDYVPGSSHSATTAENTFVDRVGICRDFTHLGISLCRALNVPARAVSAYAWQLDPPDFHAVFKVYLDGAWWLVDPTRLVPVENLVRVATGRDAADIAFLTTSGTCECLNQAVSVELVVDQRAS
jgi:transglutaminase-like putative cysteine protease